MSPKVTCRTDLLLLVWACAACGDVPPVDLPPPTGLSRLLIEEDQQGPDPLADVRGIQVLSPDSMIVLDAAPPFIRLISSAGGLVTALGRRGGGPGELERPALIQIHAENLFIVDFGMGMMAVWNTRTLQEDARVPVPQNTLALATGCGNRLLAVYRGPGDGAETRYGIAARSGDEWEDLSDLGRREINFAPTWPDFRVLADDEGVVVFDWFNSRLQQIDCSGQQRGSVPVPYPEEWRLSPKPTGMARVHGHVVLFFSDRPARVEDRTEVAVWAPGDPEVTIRRVAGDWRLHGNQQGFIWVVDSRTAPAIMAILEEDFWRWLGI
jgi:hypothetical protein